MAAAAATDLRAVLVVGLLTTTAPTRMLVAGDGIFPPVIRDDAPRPPARRHASVATAAIATILEGRTRSALATRVMATSSAAIVAMDHHGLGALLLLLVVDGVLHQLEARAGVAE
jgi:hypothetical protein